MNRIDGSKTWIQAVWKAAVLWIVLFISWSGMGQTPDFIVIEGKEVLLYPHLLKDPPPVSSPFLSDDGLEAVVIVTADGAYAVVPIALQDHPEFMFNSFWKRGMQTMVNADDFPTLALTGLHSELELASTFSITGLSVAEITEAGAPEASSGVGFIGADETILSVLKGDNRIVKSLGLTHPLLARPLMHFYNLILWKSESEKQTKEALPEIDCLLYNGAQVRLVSLKNGHGWQESIFQDEVVGFYQIRIERSLSDQETRFLMDRYPDLSEDQTADLTEKLTRLHFGEMAAYYCMRYGFYEGHTAYRADPIAITRIFGLKSIEEIEDASPGRLPEILDTHFSSAAQNGGRP